MLRWVIAFMCFGPLALPFFIVHYMSLRRREEDRT